MSDLNSQSPNDLASIDYLYAAADTLVGKENGTLVISGSAEDLALIERILRKLQIVKDKRTVHDALEAALKDAKVGTKR